jgi:hypothetical protein
LQVKCFESGEKRGIRSVILVISIAGKDEKKSKDLIIVQ